MTRKDPEPNGALPATWLEGCVDDPPFDAGLLVRFRAGGQEADEAVLVHLGRCAHCRDLLRALAPVEESAVEQILTWLPLPELEAGAGAAGESRGVQPSDLPSALPGSPAAGRKGWWVAAAIAVGVAAWWLLSPPPTPPPAYIAEPPTGGVAEVMSSGPAGATPTFHPDSPLRWVLRPASALKNPPAARAFVVRGGRLAPLPEAALRRIEGGTVVLEGQAAHLLGDEPGERVLVVGLALEPDRLSDATGRTLGEARAQAGVRWHELVVHYQRAP